MGIYEIATQRQPYHLNCLHINTLHHAKIHNNKVIYATVIDNGFSMTAYHTVVEDNFGQCAKLCILNITPILLNSLKKDTKIAIVNPFYKKGGEDGVCFIRQESPDEVIVMLDKPTVNCKNEKTWRVAYSFFFQSYLYWKLLAKMLPETFSSFGLALTFQRERS